MRAIGVGFVLETDGDVKGRILGRRAKGGGWRRIPILHDFCLWIISVLLPEAYALFPCGGNPRDLSRRSLLGFDGYIQRDAHVNSQELSTVCRTGHACDPFDLVSWKVRGRGRGYSAHDGGLKLATVSNRNENDIINVDRAVLRSVCVGVGTVEKVNVNVVGGPSRVHRRLVLPP